MKRIRTFDTYRDGTSDQAGREQRSVHDGHVGLHRSNGSNFQLAGTVSGHELVRPAALRERERAEGRKLAEVDKTELNGVEEGEDEMSVEGGDGVDGEEEFGNTRLACEGRTQELSDTEGKREEHEATHVPSRDWCTHCMMGRGRKHHHVTKQKSEDGTRRPTIAMDYYFVRMQPAVNSRTISEEAITCITVKEDRHQNIMSSAALEK